MQPYAVGADEGSTLGVGLRPGSRPWALSAERKMVPAEALMTMNAQPAKLSGLLPELPWLRAGPAPGCVWGVRRRRQDR